MKQSQPRKTKILSARGSYILPNFDIILNFLAKNPSKKSVTEAKKNNIKAK